MNLALRPILRLASVVATLAVSSTASAQLLTSIGQLNPPTNTIVDFGLSNTNVGGPYSDVIGGAENITMDYTGNDGLYFDYCGWGLGSNGSSCINSVGVNQAGVLRFTFGNGPVAGAGIDMNYAPGLGSVFIRAFDINDILLAEYEMNADAPIVGSDFQFRGIQFGSASIAAFELEGIGNPSPILSSLSYTSAITTVPEPSTVVMLAVGFIGLAGVARRRAR